MASDTPSSGKPRPDDQTPPKHESLLSDWLGAEEVGPAPGAGRHDPDPITEQVLFDDLLPLTNPPASSEPIPTAEPIPPVHLTDPEDAVADLPLAGPGSGWVDAPGGTAVPPGSALFEGGLLEGSDIFRDPNRSGTASTGSSVAPGSSIFEITPPPLGELPLASPVSTGNSDVLSGPPVEEGSDVLNRIAQPDTGNSNIFDARPEGSARFEDPGEATEPVTEIRPMDASGEWPASDPLRPNSELFGNLSAADTDPQHPGSEVFDAIPGSDVFDPSNEATRARQPGSDVFSELPTDSDMHEVDARALLGGDDEPDIQFEDSGVDLLNPIPDLPDEEIAEGGSIFDMEKIGAEGSDLDIDALPMPDEEEATESIHLPTGESGPRSDLFRGPDSGTGDHDRVSFELPDRPPGDPEPSAQVSGLIDWTAPVEGADLGSAGLSESEATEAGISDIHRLTAETPAPLAATPGPVRRPPSTIPDMSMTERRRPDSRPGSQWMFPQPKARSSKTGWLAGSALGLLVGAGGFAGAYFGGLLPSRTADTGRPVVTSTTQSTAQASVPAPVGGPAMLLAAGDPVAALKAYEAAGEVTTPEDQSGRGQARFLARLRELAAQGTTPQADDAQIKQATADLEAVVQAADSLITEEQKRAGVLAALNLGLIKEMTAGAGEARRFYLGAEKKFPAHKRVFEAAIQRVQFAPPASQPKKTARLTPRDAEELAQLAVLATVLIQAPADGTLDDDEAGFHFWEACQLNSGRDYLKAANAISLAKAVHEKRRLKLAGRGLNPLSDPLEQMFGRACTEIREYWVFKHHFYNHKELGNELREYAKTGSFPKFLDQVVAWREEAKKGGGQKVAQIQEALTKASADLKTALATAKKAETDKDAVTEKLKTATAETTKAVTEKETVAKELTSAKEMLEAQTKQLTDARKGLDDARAKQKVADNTLAIVVKELKANKLIDEKDDAATAVAKLPEVVRKASAAATSTDAKKAADALVKAQKDLEAARAETEKAEAMAKKATDEAKTLHDQMDAQVKKATDTATADARKKLDALSTQLTATKDELARREKEKADALAKAEADKADTLKKVETAFAAKLAAKEEDHRRQLADARSGVLTPLTTTEVAARERASQEYDAGVRLFFANRLSEAEVLFGRATRGDSADARYWYYLGLTQALQNKPFTEALKKGAELEARNQPGHKALNDALEPLPGTYRQWLSKFRP